MSLGQLKKLQKTASHEHVDMDLKVREKKRYIKRVETAIVKKELQPAETIMIDASSASESDDDSDDESDAGSSLPDVSTQAAENVVPPPKVTSSPPLALMCFT